MKKYNIADFFILLILSFYMIVGWNFTWVTFFKDLLQESYNTWLVLVFPLLIIPFVYANRFFEIKKK